MWMIRLPLLTLWIALALVACSPKDASTGSATAAPTQDPKALIAAGAVVIDVRTAGEWDSGHLPAAHHLPVDEVPARLAEVAAWTGGDKSKPVVVYCASGNRSGRAKRALEQAGFTHVVNGGGYNSLR